MATAVYRLEMHDDSDGHGTAEIYIPPGWDDTDGTVRYDSPDLGWIEPTHAVLVDAGDNVLADVPAVDWRRVAQEYSCWLRTGRAHMVGIVRGEEV